MRKLGTGYTMYFNVLYERTGALFQGKFKARHVDNEVYARYLFSYIHLNPVKLIEPNWKGTGISDRGRAEQYIRQYRYSSFLDYLTEGHRPQRILLAPESLPMESLPKDFEIAVNDWLQGPTL